MQHIGIAGDSADTDAPPPSVTPARQVLVIFLSFLLAGWVVLVLRPTDDPAVAAVILLVTIAIPGALSEFFWIKSWKDPAAGLDFSRAYPSVQRVMQKLVGIWAIHAALFAGYSLLPVYEQPLYEPFVRIYPQVFPWLVGLAVPYIALVDAFHKAPEDALWRFGGILLGVRGIDRTGVGNWLLGWGVKAFFLPLMFCFATGYIRDLWAFSLADTDWIVQKGYVLAYQSLYFVDVAVGALGYCMTFRLLGTHIRSAEPTVAGWVVALMCYPPFWDSIGGSYFAYSPDWEWGALLWDYPVLYTLWAMALVGLIAVYVWATLAFGLRFSNLTHRGIITNGPYRFTKHPAYVSKNLTWWLIAIPFIPEDGSLYTALACCLMLAGVNLIYYMRARTEERHLMADPVYRDYAAWIDRHGLFRRRW